jgi:putative transposase
MAKPLPLPVWDRQGGMLVIEWMDDHQATYESEPQHSVRQWVKSQPLFDWILNVLDRTFEAAAPNRKWIADFTYVWTAEGWLYVAAVIDLFSRRVVGWSMSAAMTAQLVTDALVMAIWRRGKPDALLHHSDRGSQYTSEQFQRLMADSGVVCSMSRSGNVWDNAAMESFFSSLKTERTSNKTYRTRNEAKADVFDYIERFYNSKRRHSTIGYLSPMEFERQAGFA